MQQLTQGRSRQQVGKAGAPGRVAKGESRALCLLCLREGARLVFSRHPLSLCVALCPFQQAMTPPLPGVFNIG